MGGKSPLRFTGDECNWDIATVNVLLARLEHVLDADDKPCPIKPRLTTEVLERAANNRLGRRDDAEPLAERVRWRHVNGRQRVEPLCKEDVVSALREDYGMSVASASWMATKYSSALDADDVAWLSDREQTTPDARPLDGNEYLLLARTVDALGDTQPAMAEMVAARLGSAFDSYEPAPFATQELARMFRLAHVAHLQAIRREAFQARQWPRQGLTDAERGELKERFKRAETHAVLAEHALDGVAPAPIVLTVTLETADGRALWWNVWKGAGAVMHRAEAAEVNAFADRDGSGEQTVRFSMDVAYDDAGQTRVCFDGSGDEWRYLEANGLEDAVYQRLLAGESLDDVMEDLMAPEAPTLSAM